MIDFYERGWKRGTVDDNGDPAFALRGYGGQAGSPFSSTVSPCSYSLIKFLTLPIGRALFGNVDAVNGGVALNGVGKLDNVSFDLIKDAVKETRKLFFGCFV